MRQFTRRQFGLATSASLFSLPLPLAAQRAPQQVEERSPDDWFLQWKSQAKVNKDLQGPLDLRRFKDPFYALLNEIGWKPGKSATGLQAFQVPMGFVTDFASVPRVFWSIFPPDGNYAYAAVLHDWLYWEQDRPKEDADRIFRSAMDDLTITDVKANLLYQAVNRFGITAWNRNAEIKKAGEKRVLSKLPDKPEITWEVWRIMPGVFK